LKELRLKYEMLKSKYEMELFGKKPPKRAKDEREAVKLDNEKLDQVSILINFFLLSPILQNELDCTYL